MGAKKKPDGKKKDGDEGDNPAEVSLSYKHHLNILRFIYAQIGAILEAEVDGLRTMLVLEQERCDKARRVVKEVGSDLGVLRQDLMKQEKETADCVRIMNDQYTKMEDRLT